MSVGRDTATVVALLAIVCWVWLATLLVHELGHVVAAFATGGRIAAVELRPGWLPHTLVQPNPAPNLVLWSGFVMGIAAPQAAAWLVKLNIGLIDSSVRSWAAFCVLFSGVYLVAGCWERLTDSGQLAAEGWPRWLLIAVGATLGVLGYARSRAAWIDAARRLERSRLTASHAVAWCVWLLVWSVGQWGLHLLLQPHSNVR